MAELKRPLEQTTQTEDWQVQLDALLKSCSPVARTALVGVGHPLRGDDYVGSCIVKAVLQALGDRPREGVCLFDAEDNLEATIMKLGNLNPKNIIFIDACEMGLGPGEAKFVSVRDTSYPFFTTHSIPLKVLAEQLLSESEVWVLAIQPKRTDFGENLSPEIQKTVAEVSGLIAVSLRRGD